jgi:hypothetical protein
MRSLVAGVVGVSLALLLPVCSSQFGAASPGDGGVDSSLEPDSSPAPVVDAAAMDGTARLSRDLDLTRDTLACTIPQLPTETPGTTVQVPGVGLKVHVGTGAPDVSSIVCPLPSIPGPRSRVVVDFSYLATTAASADAPSVVAIAAQVRLNKPKIDAAAVSLKAYTRTGLDDSNALALVVDFNGKDGQFAVTRLSVPPTVDLDLSLSYDFVPERGAARLTGPSGALQVQTADVAETLDLSGGVEPSLLFSNFGGRREVLLKRVRIYELPPP